MAMHIGPQAKKLPGFDIPDLEAGLHGQQQQGPVAPSIPGGEVGSGHEMRNFVFIHPADSRLPVLPGRQLDDLLAMEEQPGFSD